MQISLLKLILYFFRIQGVVKNILRIIIVNDFRPITGLFIQVYTALGFMLNFCLQENEDHNTLRAYWKHLSAVVIGCLSLFIFDMCERGVQLRNPFYSIWVTDIGTNLAVSFHDYILLLFLCAVWPLDHH
jgi:hypothetical protein